MQLVFTFRLFLLNIHIADFFICSLMRVYNIVTWMAQQDVGGRVNSVDSRGDVTYPNSFHQYTTLGKHSLPRGDGTRDNAMVITQQ
jgi:hypothetical protein